MNKTLKMLATLALPLTLALGFASCENGDKEFDDYDYQTVYFAQQNPIRTITLGEMMSSPMISTTSMSASCRSLSVASGKTIKTVM